MILSGILISLSIDEGHNWGGDFALYINQAMHLVEENFLDEVYETNKNYN